MTETAHTVSRTRTDLLYDYMNPDQEFYAPSARCATPEPGTGDPASNAPQEERVP